MGCAGSKEAPGRGNTETSAGVRYIPAQADAPTLPVEAVAKPVTQESERQATNSPQYVEQDGKPMLGSKKCLGHVSVGVVSGEDLACKDIYCKLLIREHQTMTLVALSSLQRGSNNPSWGDKFVFEMHDPHGDLVVQVQENGVSEADNFLGETVVSIKDMVYYSLCKKPIRWYTLFQSVRSGKETMSKGRVQLQLDFVPLKNSRFELGIMEGRSIKTGPKDHGAEVYVRARMGEDDGQTQLVKLRGGYPAWAHVIALPTKGADETVHCELLRRTGGKGDDVCVGKASVRLRDLLDAGMEMSEGEKMVAGTGSAASAGVQWLQLLADGMAAGELCVAGEVRTSDQAKEDFLRSLGLVWPTEPVRPPPPSPPKPVAKPRSFPPPVTPPKPPPKPPPTPSPVKKAGNTYLVCKECGCGFVTAHECEKHTQQMGHDTWALPTLPSLVEELAERTDTDIAGVLSKCDMDRDGNLNSKECGALARKVYPKAAEGQVRDFVALLGAEGQGDHSLAELEKMMVIANAFTGDVARPSMVAISPPPMNLDASSSPPLPGNPNSSPSAPLVGSCADVDLFLLVDEKARAAQGELHSLFWQWDQDGDGRLNHAELAGMVAAVFPRSSAQQRTAFQATLLDKGVSGVTLEELGGAARTSRAFHRAMLLDTRTVLGRDLTTVIREHLDAKKMALRDLFTRCDMDRDERLDRDEFRTLVSVVNPTTTEENLDDIKHNLDADNDGYVTYRELEAAMAVATAFDKTVGASSRAPPSAARRAIFDSPGTSDHSAQGKLRTSPGQSPKASSEMMHDPGRRRSFDTESPRRNSKPVLDNSPGGSRKALIPPAGLGDSPNERRSVAAGEGTLFSSIDYYTKRHNLDLKALFQQCDTDGDDVLNGEELCKLVKVVYPTSTDRDLKGFESLVSRDNEGHMTYQELEKAITLDKVYHRGMKGELMMKPGGPDLLHMIEVHMEMTRTRLMDIFKVCDRDRDNKLNPDETKTFLDRVYPQRHESKSASMARRFTLLVDRDGDGCITYKDIQLAMKGYKNSGTELHSPLNPKKGAAVDASDIFEKLAQMLKGDRERARKLFHGLDRDSNGFLTRQELYVLMKRLIPGATQKELKMTLNELQNAHARAGGDHHHKGGITFEELVDVLDELQRTSRGVKRTDLKRINGLAMTPREREEENMRLSNFYPAATRSASGTSGGGLGGGGGDGEGSTVTSRGGGGYSSTATSRPRPAGDGATSSLAPATGAEHASGGGGRQGGKPPLSGAGGSSATSRAAGGAGVPGRPPPSASGRAAVAGAGETAGLHRPDTAPAAAAASKLEGPAVEKAEEKKKADPPPRPASAPAKRAAAPPSVAGKMTASQQARLKQEEAEKAAAKQTAGSMREKTAFGAKPVNAGRPRPPPEPVNAWGDVERSRGASMRPTASSRARGKKGEGTDSAGSSGRGVKPKGTGKRTPGSRSGTSTPGTAGGTPNHPKAGGAARATRLSTATVEAAARAAAEHAAAEEDDPDDPDDAMASAASGDVVSLSGFTSTESTPMMTYESPLSALVTDEGESPNDESPVALVAAEAAYPAAESGSSRGNSEDSSGGAGGHSRSSSAVGSEDGKLGGDDPAPAIPLEAPPLEPELEVKAAAGGGKGRGGGGGGQGGTEA